VDLSEREQLEQQLSAFLDGELTDEQVAELQRMLAAWPDAKQLLAELEKTVAAVRGLPRQPSPDDLYESITAQLERSALLEPGGAGEGVPVGAASRWGWLVRLTAAAAVVLLAVGVGYMTVLREPKGPVKVDKYRGEKQLAMVEPDDSVPPADELGPRRGRKIFAAEPPKPKPVGEGPALTAPVAKVKRRAAVGVPQAAAVAGDAVGGSGRGEPTRGVASEMAAEHTRGRRFRGVDVQGPAGGVRLAVTATEPSAVWRLWLKLAQLSASEGIVVSQGAGADDSSIGEDGEAASVGSAVYRFQASRAQVRRLARRLGAVRGASLTVQRHGDMRLVDGFDGEESGEWRMGGRGMLEGRSWLAEAPEGQATEAPATQPTTDRSLGPQRCWAPAGRVQGQSRPLPLVEVTLVIRMSAAGRSSVSKPQ